MTHIPSVNSFRKTFTILRSLLLVLGIFLSSNMFSQRLTLEGKIGTTEDIDIEGINIFNLSSSKGTVTDAKGQFWIAVALNDTLSISAVHIQDKTIIIGEDQMTDKRIIINLSEKMNVLSTVTLRRPLTGYIGSDANIIPTQLPITATSIGLPNADLPQLTPTRRALYTANSTPVDALLNAISGRTKMLKKHLELEKIDALTLALLDKFPETYFTDALKIEPLNIYSFIFFCEDDPNYKMIMKQSSIEIIEFLTSKSKEYRESGN